MNKQTVITEAEIAMFQALKAENEALKASLEAAKRSKPSGGLKVSTKGALSVYGMGRFPVTLYSSQWLALLDKASEIKAFITANESTLKVKGE